MKNGKYIQYSPVFHTFACVKTLPESPCPIMRCCHKTGGKERLGGKTFRFRRYLGKRAPRMPRQNRIARIQSVLPIAGWGFCQLFNINARVFLCRHRYSMGTIVIPLPAPGKQEGVEREWSQIPENPRPSIETQTDFCYDVKNDGNISFHRKNANWNLSNSQKCLGSPYGGAVTA